MFLHIANGIQRYDLLIAFAHKQWYALHKQWCALLTIFARKQCYALLIVFAHDKWYALLIVFARKQCYALLIVFAHFSIVQDFLL